MLPKSPKKNLIMKKTLLLTPLALLFAFAFGQPAIGIDNRTDPVLQQPCVMIVLPYSPQVVIAAMENYKYEKQNDKERATYPKNYQPFRETSLIRNNPNTDLLFEIGLKNADNKNISVVYLMLTSPSVEDNNSGKQTRFDMEQAKAYLDNLANAIQTYALGQQIKLQISELSKANAKQLGLLADGYKLDAKKADLLLKPLSDSKRSVDRRKLLDQQIAENKSSQVVQELEIEKQKADLRTLMAVGKANPKDA
jgi:hypothetical protein